MRHVVRAGSIFIIWSLLTGLGSTESTSRRQGGLPKPEESPVTARLITEHESLQPNHPTRVGVLFTVEDGWHIYAQEPGDAGLPTSIQWRLPSDTAVGPIQWPPYREFLDPGNIRTFGYQGTVLLWSPLSMTVVRSAPGPSPPDSLPLAADVSWLACKDICIPGSTTLTLTLPVSAGPPALSSDASRFPPKAS